MIQLYPKGTTDFTRNGIELAPAESEVNWQIAGRYDFTMNIPREKVAGITLDYGQILKVSVPPEHVDAISLGTVSSYSPAMIDKAKHIFVEVNENTPRAVCGTPTRWTSTISF